MSNSYEFLKQIGENIRYFRRKAKLSQEELAIRANLSTSFIGGVERGVDNISVESVYRIADALNIEPYLFFVSEVHRAQEMVQRKKG